MKMKYFNKKHFRTNSIAAKFIIEIHLHRNSLAVFSLHIPIIIIFTRYLDRFPLYRVVSAAEIQPYRVISLPFEKVK